MIGYLGPKDRWQVELAKVSKDGLVDLVEHFAAIFGVTRENMLKQCQQSRKWGRFQNGQKRMEAYRADPDKFIEQLARKSQAAKKAARQRKRRAKAR